MEALPWTRHAENTGALTTLPELMRVSFHTRRGKPRGLQAAAPHPLSAQVLEEALRKGSAIVPIPSSIALAQIFLAGGGAGHKNR